MSSNNTFQDQFVQGFKPLTPQALRSLLAQGESCLPEIFGAESIESGGSVADVHKLGDDPGQRGEASFHEGSEMLEPGSKAAMGKQKCVAHISLGRRY
jgi:hypothetical protein